MTLASSNLNIDLETRMRRERAGDSEYITEGIYDQLKINEAGGGKLLFLEGGGGVGGIRLHIDRCHPFSIDKAFTGSIQYPSLSLQTFYKVVYICAL